MMNKTDYRLNNFRITEYEDGRLCWETHAGLGVQRTGRCYVLDNVLIIGNSNHEEIGCLIGEFYDQLKRLPDWNKTTYYCHVFELLDVTSGVSLADDFLIQTVALREVKRKNIKSEIIMKTSIFHLEKYQITLSANDKISWQAYEGSNRLTGGKCAIESDLLLLEPKEYEKEGHNKKEFIENLCQIPQWNRTLAWGRRSILRDCIPFRNKTDQNTWVKNMNKIVIHEKLYNRCEDLIIKLYRSGFSRLKTRHSIISSKNRLKK
jgi:hypothetical protein